MTAAATSSRTPRSPWTSHSQSRSHHKPSTTPHGHPPRTPASTGVPGGSSLTPNPRSPPFTSEQRNGSSPGYFGLKVEPGTNIPTDSNPGGHVKKNWKTPSIHSPNTPNRIPHESDPGLADFRRQSETHTFTLGHGNNLSGFSSPPSSARTVVERSMSERTDSSAVSPATHIPGSLARQPSAMDIDDDQRAPPNGFQFGPSVPNFGLERRESPVNIPTLRNPSINEVSSVDDRHPRLSLPQQRVQHMTHSASPIGRASTLPTALAENPIFLSPQELIDLLQQTDSERLLLLDLRVSPQYSQSRIKGALNLCIPTTLLKRPSFNVQKLSETFTVDKEKDQFSHWKDVAYIVVYDANSANLKDAVSSVNTLKKFTNEGWKGSSCIIRGGFSEVSQKFPELVDKPSGRGSGGSNVNNLTINSGAASSLNVAGGCPMPAARTAANPFFGNIRQNMDLIGGVGQMSIKQPNALTQKTFAYLPAWLRKAANEEDKGKAVSDEFLNIEKAEQSRMQTALSTNVSYGTPNPNANSSIQVAGIEKGTKNRYKDILPFDHSRVHLDVEPGACDYINASHVKAEWSNRHYIATQAPVPATFEDFWRLVWEQDVRVIVMLTAESEGGQRKSHPYWLPDRYGQMKVKALSEKRVSLESSSNLSPNYKKPPLISPLERPAQGRRRATNPHGSATQETATVSSESEPPSITVRKLTLNHASFPFQPLREITQIHYSAWPDFGAPANPNDILGLIEHCDAAIRSHNGQSNSNSRLPAPSGERPILVHCSAGCGRTGTFCTVDSVIDMLKQQRKAQQELPRRSSVDDDEMDVDDHSEWVDRDDTDLVEKSVRDFRLQRLSMVQTLRQYVLCYETVLEWMVKEMPEKFRRDAMRRSYHG